MSSSADSRQADHPASRSDPTADGRFNFEGSTVTWAVGEFIDHPPPLAARGIVYILTALLVTAVLFSAVFQVALTVEGPGSLTTESALLPVRTSTDFRVARLAVKETQFVHKGEVLMVSADELSDDGYAKIKGDTTELQALIDQDKSGRCEDCLAKYSELEAHGFSTENRAALKDIVSPIQETLHTFLIRRRDYAALPTLVEGLKNQIALDQKRLGEISRRKAEKILAMDVDRLNQEILTDRASIAEKEQALRTDLIQTRSHLEVALANLRGAMEKYHEQQTLIAPFDATVSNLQVSGSGQFLTAGQVALSLVPRDSVFIAELEVANKDISRIRPGMEAKLKLDALPEREFGALGGTVLSVPAAVAPDPDPTRERDARKNYKVQVKLARQSLAKDGVEYPFKHGMTLTGEIVTERRTLLRLALRKMFNLQDELFHN